MDWLLGIVSAVSGSTTLLLAGALVWAVREARSADRMAVAAAKETLQAREETAAVSGERDSARAALAQRTDELAIATARIGTVEMALAIERRRRVDADSAKVDAATPVDAPAAVDELLRAEAARRAGDHGTAEAAAVSSAGPASDGPTPGWVNV